MLTTTYTLITLSVEQKTSRTILSQLQESIRNILRKVHEYDLGQFKSVLEKLAQFDQYCHRRKMELYVIPAIRGVTHEVDALLAELESFSQQGMHQLQAAREKISQALKAGADQLAELYHVVVDYCDNLRRRFDKEEGELMPLVSSLLTSEQWFPIAAQCLSDHADK